MYLMIKKSLEVCSQVGPNKLFDSKNYFKININVINTTKKEKPEDIIKKWLNLDIFHSQYPKLF